MSDLTIPSAVAAPIALALTGAIGALWAKIGSVEKRERDDCDKRIRPLEERIERLEQDGSKWRERWALEVQRGATLAARPRRPEEPPPSELPAPTWDECTEVRTARATLERQALDDELRRYSESTPPRQRMPSRPR